MLRICQLILIPKMAAESRTRASLSIVLIVVCFATGRCHSSNIYIPELPEVHYRQLGDFNLGVLLPVHEYTTRGFCGEKIAEFSTMQRIEAIKAAIDEVNARDDILPDSTLGFIMYDDCHKGVTALAQTLHFIEDRAHRSDSCAATRGEGCTNGSISTYDVAGLIASENSLTTAQVANMFTSFRIPQLSYLATAAGFTAGEKYPYFQRTLPPDTHQAAAIVSLMLHFQWTYVSVIYSEGEYGNQGYKVLHEEARRNGVCFVKAKEVPLAWGLGQYQRLMLDLLLRKNVSIVVAFLSSAQARMLLEAADRMKVGGRITWIATDAWARHLGDLQGRLDAALGAISIQIESRVVSRFNSLYQTLEVGSTENPWMEEYLETFFNCTLNEGRRGRYRSCPKKLRLHRHKDYVPEKVVSLIYDTVFAYARALHAAMVTSCKTFTGNAQRRCATSALARHLANLSFVGEGEVDVTFGPGRSVGRRYVIYNVQNRTGKWRMEDIAQYDHYQRALTFTGRQIQWSRGRQPRSTCSKPCEKGHAQLVLGTMCCWMCEPCAPNQYTRVLWGLHQCFTCRPGTRPDPETRTQCEPIIPIYIQWHEPLGVIVATSSSIGLLCCAAIFVLFVVNNQHPLVKASSRELSYHLLASVVTSYACCFCFIVKPSKTVCLLRLLVLSLCFTLMYGPLVIKTTRIYRIFEAGRMMNRRPTCVTSKTQIGIVLGIELFHVCIIALWSAIAKPAVLEVSVSDTVLELRCDFPQGPFITSLAYNFLLLVASVYCAFKTRKLPDNFSESKFIGFCVYSTVVIWLAFIPAYFTVPSAFYQTMLLCLAVLLNATLVLSCIFCPKIYAIYRVRHSDQHWSPNFLAVRGASHFVCHPDDIHAARLRVASMPISVRGAASHGNHTPPGGDKGEATRGQCDGGLSAPPSECTVNQPRENGMMGSEGRYAQTRKLDAREPTLDITGGLY